MKKNGPSLLKTFLNGVIHENPVLVLVLGTCPSLAVTTLAKNGIGMGAAATIVLVCSNLFISLLKNVIPKKVRIPAYITIIAGFVTMVQLLVKAYFPDIDKSLGIFLPLIVVNCIILARAEMFASKNSPLASIVDGLGMGIGFTFALLIIGSVREILGAGTWFGIPLTVNYVSPMMIFVMPAGGFFVFGVVIAVMNAILKRKGRKIEKIGCAFCPSREFCAEHQNEGGNK
ncbi:MAG: electron transport complex subunit E [Oscillospiraceae bacterium]|nr:electron transport complex subunit E [Oscillospiraceae bacterium]